jgi:hypothetical protein
MLVAGRTRAGILAEALAARLAAHGRETGARAGLG